MCKILTTTVVSTALFIIACGKTTPISVPSVPAAYTNMNEFLEALAVEANKRLGGSDDFRVVVTQAQYAIGTLMRTGSTIPIDYTACLPVKSPPVLPAPNLFPTYEISSDLSVGFGLDNEIIKKLVDFDIIVKNTDTISISVKGSKIQSMADNDMVKILSQNDCKGAIPNPNAWLVRGYVFGQRLFILKNEKANNIKGKFIKFGSFNISVDSGNATLNFTDSSDIGFLQIVSQVSTSNDSTNYLSLKKPEMIKAIGKVYVQRDRYDATSKAEFVVAALRSAAFTVSSRIESIDTSHMPRVAQVRYFNETDKPLA